MSFKDKHKTFSTALTSAKVVRRQILDQIIELVKLDELRTRGSTPTWSDVGSIERQHDHLCRILAELKKSRNT